MKKNLAIVGSGISAMACAYYLRDDYNISIFEKNDYLGGHTHTHELLEEGKNFTIDTGFIVFNLETYKNLINLFEELGVEKQKSNMSFSVYNKKNNLQYGSASLVSMFAQKKNIFSPKYWRFLKEIQKFFKVALRDYKTIRGSEETIIEYCERNGLSKFFIDNYLAPLSSAVWSTPHNDVYNFPISLLLPFFFNHGLLGINAQHQWYTVRGGSNDYIKKIVEKGDFDIHLNEGAEEVIESEQGVLLKTSRDEYNFDYIVLASHSNESLDIFKNLSSEKKGMLSKYDYNANRAVLHTDTSVMPPLKNTWSSWNNVIDEKDGKLISSTVYWMNNLQKPKVAKDYFVSINPFREIDKNKIIKEINYDHPNFTVENFLLQEKLPKINENTRVLLAGAYFGYGFHEDGIKSGLAVVEILKNKD
jgi:predicted NAD/FAD-binding protein